MDSGITVTSNPDPAQIESLGVSNWPIWVCGVSTSPCTYDEYLQNLGHSNCIL